MRADSYFAEGNGKGSDLNEKEENETYTKKKEENEDGKGIIEHGLLLASSDRLRKGSSLLQLSKVRIC